MNRLGSVNSYNLSGDDDAEILDWHLEVGGQLQVKMLWITTYLFDTQRFWAVFYPFDI